MSSSTDIKIRALGILDTFRHEYPKLFGSSPANSGTEHLPDSPTLDGTHSGHGVDVAAFISWLDHRVTVKGLSDTTAKCYRRWVAKHLEDVGHRGTGELRAWIPPGQRVALAEAAAMSPEHVLLNDADDSKLFEAAAQGNSRYLSFISEPVLEIVISDLMPAARTPAEDANPSRNRIAAMETALWFTCTLWTGLRPREWPYARFLEEHFDPDTGVTQKQVLEVRTLKQSGRREDNPLKEKRYLVLDQWPESQITALKMFLGMVQAHEDTDTFDAFYLRRRLLLHRAWKRVMKRYDGGMAYIDVEIAASNKRRLKSIAESTSSPGVFKGSSLTFYTARHVFAEEARRDRFSKFEIAAVLGHSMITNQSYYGQRRSTLSREHQFVLPRPWPGDADAIELWDKTANPLRFKYMTKDELSQSILDIESKNRDRDETDGVSAAWLK